MGLVKTLRSIFAEVHSPEGVVLTSLWGLRVKKGSASVLASGPSTIALAMDLHSAATNLLPTGNNGGRLSGSGSLSAVLIRFPPVRTVGRVAPLVGYYRPRRTGLRQRVKTVQLTQWVRVHVRERCFMTQ